MVVHHHQVKDYDKLHPALKERYNRAFMAEGIMEEIGGGTKLIRFLFKVGPLFRCFFLKEGEIFLPNCEQAFLRQVREKKGCTGFERSIFLTRKDILMQI